MTLGSWENNGPIFSILEHFQGTSRPPLDIFGSIPSSSLGPGASCSEIKLLTRVALWELSASNSVWRGLGLIALSQLPRDFVCLSGQKALIDYSFWDSGSYVLRSPDSGLGGPLLPKFWL